MSRTMKDNEAAGEGAGGNGSADEVDEARTGPELDPAIQTALGRELRAMYDEVVSEPVPDRFLKLLEKLDAPEHGGRSQPK